jgi:hypothetical protein
MTNNDDVFEVYFSDLKLKAQRELLKFLKIKSDEQLNLDVLPLVEIPRRNLDES